MNHHTTLKLVKTEGIEFYDLFHGDNEAYIEFILKYVEDYLEHSREIAHTYSVLLKEADATHFLSFFN